MQGGGGWGPPPGGPPQYPPQQQPPQYGQQPPYPQHPQQQPYPQHPQQQPYGAPPPGGYGAPMQPGYPQQQVQPFGFQAMGPAGMPGPNGFTSCPRCQSPSVSRPTFTWWGGMVGPAILKHAVCGSCSYGFNYRTGKPNATAIGIYFAVIFAIVIMGTILSALAH